MTRVLVVVESMFGNTRAVGEAVADGLRTSSDVDAVDIVDVAAAPAAPAVDLLVLGGPTHA
ncbi:MAG: flavodoxin, partial [Sporichthyaceae bacterium]